MTVGQGSDDLRGQVLRAGHRFRPGSNPAGLKGGSDDGTSGGMSDDWKASVDRQLAQLHEDVRALLNRGVLAAIGLAGMIAGLYLYTNAKFDAVNKTLTAVEVQQAKADSKLDLLLERTAPKPAK